mmetsp:Transcript_42016/g.97859  ORF Transcript_42016/g.97859 Transcript_42016/m.97859 type:complete len:99 (-) Transcript_42016:235-531(-)
MAWELDGPSGETPTFPGRGGTQRSLASLDTLQHDPKLGPRGFPQEPVTFCHDFSIAILSDLHPSITFILRRDCTSPRKNETGDSVVQLLRSPECDSLS